MLDLPRRRLLTSRISQLLLKTCLKWQRDNCLEMGAALSYYALFSLFPIFLVANSVLGFLIGSEAMVLQRILIFAEAAFPGEAVNMIQDVLLQIHQQSVRAGVIGFLLVLFTASGVFGALDRSVDRIWNVHQHPTEGQGFRTMVMAFLRKKLFAFALVMSTAGLLLFSLIFNIVIKGMIELIETMNRAIVLIHLDNLWIAQQLHWISAFFLVALSVLFLLRFLPSTEIAWKDLWPATVLTASLLVGLQNLVSRNIIQIGANYQSYGVVGSVMILMLWVYLACQIFFFGCEFSYVYTHLYGSRRYQDLEL